MTPPPLAWLPNFTHSLTGALGTAVTFDISKTVNPLVLKIKMRFQEDISSWKLMLIWNLFQKYAAKNSCFPQGKTGGESREIIFAVAVERRFGPPKNESPLE